MARYERKTPPKTEAARQEALLLALRQVSREAAERFPRVTKSNLRRLNAFVRERLQELRGETE